MIVEGLIVVGHTSLKIAHTVEARVRGCFPKTCEWAKYQNRHSSKSIWVTKHTDFMSIWMAKRQAISTDAFQAC